MAPVVVAESLTKRFGELVAVDDLSFALERGTITGFLGPNGAGKTTTLRMLLGLAAPTRGSALVFDRPYARLEQPALRVGAVLEATDFHPGRSGRNHLLTLGRATGLPDARADEVLRLVELDGAAGRRVKGYSLGMRQRLGLAAALLGDPELLVLDEPANGLDPEGVRWLRDFLRAFAADGKTVFVSSHVLSEVAQTVDRVLIVNRGRLVIESPLAELTARLGGAVRVRSPQAAELQEALRRESLEAAADGDGVLVVHGSTTERVGEIAAAGGIVLHELTAHSSSLEQVFLELTSDAAVVIAQTRAEVLKIRSTRTTLGLVAGMVSLLLLAVLLTGFLTETVSIAREQDQRDLLSLGNLSGLFAALAGVLLVTGEYRFGTIRPTFLFTPRRSTVVGAKLVAGMLAGVVFAVRRGRARLRDRRADPLDEGRDPVARRQCGRPAPARDAGLDGALGRHRGRGRNDPAQPDRRGDRRARLGVRRRPAPVRARAVGRQAPPDRRDERGDRRPGPEPRRTCSGWRVARRVGARTRRRGRRRDGPPRRRLTRGWTPCRPRVPEPRPAP